MSAPIDLLAVNNPRSLYRRAVLELSHSQPRAPKSHIAVQYTERLSEPKPTSAVISDTPYLIERGQGVVWQLEFRRRKILAQMSDG